MDTNVLMDAKPILDSGIMDAGVQSHVTIMANCSIMFVATVFAVPALVVVGRHSKVREK
jgi:hypothetical protein